MTPDLHAHLDLALARLDVLLHREILRLRATDQLSTDELRGLYISDAQVDALVGDARARAGRTNDDEAVVALSARAAELRAEAAARGAELPWARLVRLFGLQPLDEDILLMAVALDVDAKYETIYGYLNNDVSRRWPTFGAALSLVTSARAARLQARTRLAPDAPLLARGLLRPLPARAERASWLATGFRASATVVRHVLGESLGAPEGARLVATTDHDDGLDPLPAELRVELARLGNHARLDAAPARHALLVLEGRSGTGRGAAAHAFAAAAGARLVRVDVDAVPGREAAERLALELELGARLEPTTLLFSHAEALLSPDGRPAPETRPLAALCARFPGSVCLAVPPATPRGELGGERPQIVVALRDPPVELRSQQWRRSLQGARVAAADADVDAVADMFTLTPRQIVAAARAAAFAAQGGGSAAADAATLFAAARAQSAQRLGDLATPLETVHDWTDLVLPPATLRRLREIAGAVAHRRLVYGDWGLGRGGSPGLKILFSGASGTGKTMAAGVMARALGLALFRVDLSTVVSKYIGETEKNLSRIFEAAVAANVVLFFDEADALFGKRSEVKDAHDRYANIEVGYLLQRLEQYDGLVILASNLGRNIDEAFSRRLYEVIEFPLPDDAQRERLWRSFLGPAVPVGDDVDARFLAKQFPLAGGDIRNVAVEAAFLAAQDGRVVTMEKLVRAMARQVLKQGRIPSAADFKQYHALLEREADA